MSNFNLFRNEVLSLYREKKNRNELHSKFNDPSPANLRDYSLVVLSKGLTEVDKKIMQEFYNPTSKYVTLEEAIKKIDIGRLKSVQNFITEKTRDPEELIVKLIAVLVDYHPRPFILEEWEPKEEREKWIGLIGNENVIDDKNCKTDNEGVPMSKNKVDKKVSSMNMESGKQNNTDVESLRQPREKQQLSHLTSNINRDHKQENIYKPSKSTKPKKIASAVLGSLVGLSCVTAYFSQHKQCMCWVEYQYVKVSCQDQANRPNVIALQEEKLTHFRKILRSDTLTLNDVNKVWYSKINNEVEFFTAPGMHPVHEHRSLKSATKHIIETYAGEQP